MKKITVVIVFLVTGILSVCSFAGADDRENMAKWAGIQRVEGWIGAKEVFDSNGNRFSANAQIIFYPIVWESEDGVNLLGLGAKGNYWSSDDGHGFRALGQVDLEVYRRWGKLRAAILAGIQDEEYGKSKPHHDLFGAGIYSSLNHGGKFPKTEFWGQYLWANASNGGKLTGILDVGGRQFLVKDGAIKPYIQADLSIGTPDNFANLGLAIGITDRNEIFYVSVGPEINLKKGISGHPWTLFINAGLSTSNAVDTAIRKSAAKDVKPVNYQAPGK